VKNKLVIRFSLLATLIWISSIASLSHAQSSTRYISDVLEVPLQTSMDNAAEVTATLTSGTRLTLLRQDQDSQDNSWALVRTGEGEEGWIPAELLLSEPTAAVQLQRLNAQLARGSAASRQAGELQKQLAQLREEYESLQQEYRDEAMHTAEANQASVSKLTEENQRAHESNQLLQTRVDVLQAENEQLKDTQRYNQWFFGAGLVICGVILSFFLQALGKRKRQSEWR